ncbi:homeobox-leucine zipper protein HOX11-like isoform X1 [Tripterygium wilfordii]|uniref:homeobox-leucine zipper protein HOX11-like isoform X1 n=1 Tax=Tripterygium wilfordii TaxID=458696 RepID=UPI0018F7E8BC|nr:homeobox-leucine zipper protein HOX11-like isoform X1 [Tripterygium wilfordii]
MELGLSLGDTKNPFGATTTTTNHHHHHHNNGNNKGGLRLCMALSISPSSSNHHVQEEEEQDHQPIQQLQLLPNTPVPRTGSGGGNEVGSSSSRRLDVNRFPSLAVEEEAEDGAARVSSSPPNSGGSSFLMDFCIYTGGSDQNKRVIVINDDVNNESGDIHHQRGSDEDENGNARKKLRLSKDQSAFLEDSFKEHNTLNPKQKLALAKQLNLRPRQVEVWFQNRRARTKLKQTEVDCEYLKRCCETLTEENRRLHKELQELRALKSTNPFYMQLPATTLTMCPSCEKVATTTTTTTNSTTRPSLFPFSAKPNSPNNPQQSNNPS